MLGDDNRVSRHRKESGERSEIVMAKAHPVTTQIKSSNSKEAFAKFLRTLGPGLITGASDDDPSGIGTYSQTGAQFGYTQLWTALFTLPLMTSIVMLNSR